MRLRFSAGVFSFYSLALRCTIDEIAFVLRHFDHHNDCSENISHYGPFGPLWFLSTANRDRDEKPRFYRCDCVTSGTIFLSIRTTQNTPYRLRAHPLQQPSSCPTLHEDILGIQLIDTASGATIHHYYYHISIHSSVACRIISSSIVQLIVIDVGGLVSPTE